MKKDLSKHLPKEIVYIEGKSPFSIFFIIVLNTGGEQGYS